MRVPMYSVAPARRAARASSRAAAGSGARVRCPAIVAVLVAGIAVAVVACGGPAVTPRITPGTSAHPRDVVILAKDYTFFPTVVDLVPGETVVLRVINGGVVVHEAVIGPMSVQDAWERAEAPTASAPPGRTPEVSVPPGLGGIRVFVGSGERRDAPWTVPPGATADGGGWFVGCHIPGHWAQGMVVPVRWVGPDGVPLASAPATAAAGSPS